MTKPFFPKRSRLSAVRINSGGNNAPDSADCNGSDTMKLRKGWLIDAGSWAVRAAERKEAILKVLWCAESASFRDCDFVHGRHSPVDAASGFLPLFAGLVSPDMAGEQARVLPLMEGSHGVACTTLMKGGPPRQWAFPNAWPPMVYFLVGGLDRYGFREDAERVAQKFLATQSRLLAETGQLWEKSNVLTGTVGSAEYKAAPMMGWTAGVVRALQGKFSKARD